MTDPTTINQSDEVTEGCLRDAEAVFEGWFDNDEPIDWDSFWDRLDTHGWSVITTDCPAARKIQRHIRRFKETV